MSVRARVALLGYAIALYLVFVPLLDTAVRVAPLDFGNLQWRYGTLGFVSRALEVPLLGLLIAFSVALAFQHVLVSKVLGWLLLLGSITLIAASGVFAWDVISMRAIVIPEMRRSFLISAGLASAKYGSAVLVSLAFAWVGLRVRRSR